MPQNAQGFATKLANDWHVGEQTTHKGVLALFSIKDRGYFVAGTTTLDAGVTDRISAGFASRALGELKRGDVGRAMTYAAESIATSLPEAPAAGGTRTNHTTTTRTTTTHSGTGSPGGRSRGSSGVGVVAAFTFLVMLVGVFVLPVMLGISILRFFVGLFTGGARASSGGLRAFHRPEPAASGCGCLPFIVVLVLLIFLIKSGALAGFIEIVFMGVMVLLAVLGGGRSRRHGGSSWSGTTTGSWTSSSSSDSSSSFDTFGGGNFDGGGSGGSW
jgi:uncharacterized membrane protein YgcG